MLPLFPFHLCMCLCIHICIYICMYLYVCLYFTWEMSRARNEFCWIFIIILLLKMTLMQNTCSLGEMLNSPNWTCFDLKQWVWALLLCLNISFFFPRLVLTNAQVILLTHCLMFVVIRKLRGISVETCSCECCCFRTVTQEFLPYVDNWMVHNPYK